MKNLSARVLRALYQSIFIYTKMKNLEKMNNSGGRALHALYEWGFIAKKKRVTEYFFVIPPTIMLEYDIFFTHMSPKWQRSVFICTQMKNLRARATCAPSINLYMYKNEKIFEHMWIQKSSIIHICFILFENVSYTAGNQ